MNAIDFSARGQRPFKGPASANVRQVVLTTLGLLAENLARGSARRTSCVLPSETTELWLEPYPPEHNAIDEVLSDSRLQLVERLRRAGL